MIRYDVRDGVATVTIDRPEKRNAMTYAMLAEFNAALARASSDDDARVVVLTGSGGSFCAGTDLSDLSSREAGDRGGTPGGVGTPAGPWPIARCPKPVIAAVDGAAVGMGAEFTSQCDIRVATTRARFAWNFAHRGLVPDTGAGTWLLPKLIGLPAALRLLYSGDFLGADDALAIGYVHRVVEPDDLPQAAGEVAASFLRGSPLAQRLVKSLVYEGLDRSLDEHLAAHGEALRACFASEDHREGVASFLERREAKFTGR